MQISRDRSEVCVSWDFEAAGGIGNWTSVGCTTADVIDESADGDEMLIVTCRCTHLTNFAILVVSI